MYPEVLGDINRKIEYTPLLKCPIRTEKEEMVKKGTSDPPGA